MLEGYVSDFSELFGISTFGAEISKNILSTSYRLGGEEEASPKPAPIGRVYKKCDRRPF